MRRILSAIVIGIFLFNGISFAQDDQMDAAQKEDMIKRFLAEADQLTAQGSGVSAGGSYRRVLELDPQNAEANAGLAALDKAQKSDMIERLLTEGEQLAGQGNYSSSRDSYRRVLELDSQNVKAHIGLAYAEYSNSNNSEALLYFEQAEKLGIPESWQSNFYFLYGSALVKRQDYNKALEIFEKLKEININDVNAYKGLMAVYSVNHNPEKVIVNAEKIVELEPDVTTCAILGKEYIDSKQYDKAKAVLLKGKGLGQHNQFPGMDKVIDDLLSSIPK